jgi:hypothetical protein
MAWVTAFLAALILSRAADIRSATDDKWCNSFDYREDSREYAACRARID